MKHFVPLKHGAERLPPSLPEVFLRADAPERMNQDREDGQNAFLILTDEARIGLITDLIMHLEDMKPLNTAATGSAFRLAWELEPYLGGKRLGTYFSAAEIISAGRFESGVSEIVGRLANEMMTADERRRLSETKAPLIVYRGGVGDPASISQGMSWTTDISCADFYARKWLVRWGAAGEPRILSSQIEPEVVAAMFDGRDESEILIPNGLPVERVVEVPTLSDVKPRSSGSC